MTKPHASILGALDGFFDAIRRRAEADPTFAAEVAKALAIPVEIKIERTGNTVNISVRYTVTVDLLVRKLDLQFAPSAGNRNIMAKPGT